MSEFIKTKEDLKELVLWMKSEGVLYFRVGDIELRFSDLAVARNLYEEPGQPPADGGPDPSQEKPTDDGRRMPPQDDPDLFYVSG